MSDAINPPLSQKTRRKRQLLWSYGLIMLAAMAVAGALGIAAGYLENVKDPPAWLIAARDVFNFPWWPAVLMAALLAYALWWSLAYWRQLDELARAAHERAWFWGGSIAMGVALAAEDTGGSIARTMSVDLGKGDVRVRTRDHNGMLWAPGMTVTVSRGIEP